jgi:hypothetical protein
MKTKLIAKRKHLLAITAIIALAVVAIITIAWNTRSTKADVDCSGPWWTSTDPTVYDACYAVDIGTKPNYDPVGALETATWIPGTTNDPGYTPGPFLPEPDELKTAYPAPYVPDNPDKGPLDPNWSGASTLWVDGAVPVGNNYMAWQELFVMTLPGNGASYVEISTGDTITVTTNPVIQTEVGFAGTGDPTYQKVWTDPQADGALYITNITNTDYTNTDPTIPYPGPQSVVFFTTASGQTGEFNMATGAWSFDTMGGPVPTPTAPPAYP